MATNTEPTADVPTAENTETVAFDVFRDDEAFPEEGGANILVDPCNPRDDFPYQLVAHARGLVEVSGAFTADTVEDGEYIPRAGVIYFNPDTGAILGSEILYNPY